MRKYLVPLRRSVQTGVFLFIAAIIWNTAFPLERFINPSFLFHMDPLAMVMTSIAERVLLPGLLLSALMLFLSLILGRFFCGWLCPLGALMDFFSWPMKRLREAVTLLKGKAESGPIRYLKYFLLGGLFTAALAGWQLVWFFDPITIFVRTFSMSAHPPINSALDSFSVSGGLQLFDGIKGFIRSAVISPEIPVFPHSGLVLAIFTGVMLAVIIRKRFWCRYLCPLGALYALPARISLLQRETGSCIANCSICARGCRMGAIRADQSYSKSECVLCMDCLTGCPVQSSVFRFRKIRSGADLFSGGPSEHEIMEQRSGPMAVTEKAPGVFTAEITRAAFMRWSGGTLLAAALPALPLSGAGEAEPVLRPPGALPGDEFLQRCIRCGNCMKVCPANFIQPAPPAAGLKAMWSPLGDPVTGYCEYECNLCGRVCPTGALEELTMDQKTVFKIGLAEINKKTCVPWIRDENCIVCEEHCPVPDKAIKLISHKAGRGLIIKRPVVDKELCIGCAICENRCPVEGEKGIIVKAVKGLH